MPDARCAVHPAHPGPGPCPECGRPAVLLAAVTRVALADTALALAGAAVGLEYVGAQFFSVVWPLLVGMACGAAALVAIRPVRRGWLARGMAAGYAALSAAYAFRFTVQPFGPVGRWLPPLAAAVLGAVLLPGLITSAGAASRSPGRAGPRRSKRD